MALNQINGIRATLLNNENCGILELHIKSTDNTNLRIYMWYIGGTGSLCMSVQVDFWAIQWNLRITGTGLLSFVQILSISMSEIAIEPDHAMFG